MADFKSSTQQTKGRKAPIMRTFAEGPISAISPWREIDDGVGICRITVIGEAAGPASSPPRVTFYVRDGGDPEAGHALRPDEARRCALGLIVGDVVRLVGDLGPERDGVMHQEVILTEEVKCRWQAERVACRVKESGDCHDGLGSAAVFGDEGMAGDDTYDGETVVCDACKVAGDPEGVEEEADPFFEEFERVGGMEAVA
jgi:hypothetical protein